MDDARDINVVLPMYILKEYSDNYSKTSGILWKFYRDEPALDDDGDTANFNAANALANLFKIKDNIACQTGDDGTKNVKIRVQ